MSYLEEIKSQINHRDFSKLLVLWEEYCANDSVDIEEYKEILSAIKSSDLSIPFGKYVENGLTLWSLIDNLEDSYEVLRLIIDLQTTNTSALADIATDAIKKKHPNDPHSNERIRLVGLRSRQNFQGSISNYELLHHMKKGNYVFHIGGWDAGEIVDVSPVREQLAVEFEFVAGSKHFTYTNAFKTLTPLPNSHFLSRRFANPDLLEQQARENPNDIIHTLLRDLGPKTAAEIKDELCELVIPEKDWTKWWQWCRTKLKKDPIVDTPSSIKQPFRLRKAELTEKDMLQQALQQTVSPNEIILQCYNLVRDIPAVLKNPDVNKMLRQAMLGLLDAKDIPPSIAIQVSIFFENTFNETLEGRSVASLIQGSTDLASLIDGIEILAYKKRVLIAIREHRPDWIPLFLGFFNNLTNAPLRDFVLKELNEGEAKPSLSDAINELLQNPTKNPELFVWYFQKIVGKEGHDLPFHDKESQQVFFESFLILYNSIELKPEYRELLKKMYAILSGQRFAVVRQLLEGTTLEFVKEYLLLVSKCQSLSDHDVKILRSLAEVVHPSLIVRKKTKNQSLTDGHIIWTTDDGYQRTKNRIQTIGTVEIVENAREIEAARAHGDLRENSEFKFALERRAHLQGQLKFLSEQLNRARIITKDDVNPNEVSIGTIAKLQINGKGETIYTILGPWDADPEKGILSFQSQLAQSLIGLKKGDTLRFREEDITLTEIKTIFD